MKIPEEFNDIEKSKPTQRRDVQLLFSDGTTDTGYYHKSPLRGDLWIGSDSILVKDENKQVVGWRELMG